MQKHAIAHVQNQLENKKSLLVEWTDGSSDEFHYIWLRDNDPALRANNGQITHNPFELDLDVRPTALSFSNSEVVIDWSDGHNTSRFDAAWLQNNSYAPARVKKRRALRPSWGADEMKTRFFKRDYNAVMSSVAEQGRLLKDLWQNGFAVVQNAPSEDRTVLKFIKFFGYVRETNYGAMFELMGSPTAEDRGHDNAFLPNHVDNPYRDPIPTLQVLHFLRNSVSGGESTVVDGIRLAEAVRAEDPEAFELLSTTTVTFRYVDEDVDLKSEGPIIRRNARGEITGVLASPINVQPFDCAPEKMLAFYKAYKIYGAYAHDPKFCFQTKMNTGDIFILDNTRVLHGRTAFTSDGSRCLQGCYADLDAIWSKLAKIETKFPLV